MCENGENVQCQSVKTDGIYGAAFDANALIPRRKPFPDE